VVEFLRGRLLLERERHRGREENLGFVLAASVLLSRNSGFCLVDDTANNPVCFGMFVVT